MTQRMTIRNNGNVGIGMTDPGAAFEVRATDMDGEVSGTSQVISRYSAGSDGILNIFAIATGNGEENLGLQTQIDGRAFETDVSGGWSYSTISRYNLVLQPYRGSVGIGKTDPSVLLDLKRDSVNGCTIQLESSGGYKTSIGQKSSASTDRSLQFTSYGYAGSNPAYKFLTQDSSGTGFIEALNITGDGLVGVGLNNPGARFQVNNVSNSTNCFYCASINGSNSTYNTYINQRAVNFAASPLFDFKCNEYQQNQVTTGPGLQVTGREGMAMLCVKQSGEVGIGTNSNGKLRVRTQGSANVGGAPNITQFSVGHYDSLAEIHAFLGTSGNADANAHSRLWSLRPGLSWNDLVFTGSNFHFEAVGGGMYFQSGGIHSDDRLKSEEEYIENALSTIMKLKPQKYKKDTFLPNDPAKEVTENMIEMKKNLRREEAGLIVQDVWYDTPELRYTITLSDDAQPAETKPPEPVPGDPSVDPDYTTWGTKKAALDYNSVFVYNIKATQELKLRLDEIESQINSIHTRLDTLEAS
jgi:hypothetical protein